MDNKCNFCGSESIVVDTPYVELKRNGEYGPITTFCCRAQKANNQYVASNFKSGEEPDLDDVSKY